MGWLKPNTGERVEATDVQQTRDDNAIMNALWNNKRFGHLWSGCWEQLGHPSQSEADMELVCLFMEQGATNEQAWTLFLSSGLGKRNKAKRHDYRDRTIREARGRVMGKQPQVQINRVPLEPMSNEDAPLIAMYPKPIGASAYIGFPGDFVRHMMDNDITEADPNILLVNFLQMARVIIGNSPSLYVTAGLHDRANLFTVNVGDTSTGRKGTSQANIADLYADVDPEFQWRIRSDVSTGDGIVDKVRDPKQHPTDPKKSDPGEPDKRLFIELGEFAAVFAQMRRAGNNISEVLRQAYDGKNLTNSSKTNPQRATRPHIAVQGHITIDELLKQPEIETILANGFANRFIWLCSKRYKVLPETRQWDRDTKGAFQERLSKVISAARTVQDIVFTPEAKDLYGRIYTAQANSADPLERRATGNMRRLAMIYSLLDESQVGSTFQRLITVSHLNAAHEIIRYSAESAKFIFSGHKTNGDAERIYNLIAFNMDNNKPTSKTEIIREFKNNKSNSHINAVLKELVRQKRITAGTVSTGGRSKEVFEII